MIYDTCTGYHFMKVALLASLSHVYWLSFYGSGIYSLYCFLL